MSIHIQRLHSLMEGVKISVSQGSSIRRYTILRTKILTLFHKIITSPQFATYKFEGGSRNGIKQLTKTERTYFDILAVSMCFNFLQNSTNPARASEKDRLLKDAIESVDALKQGTCWLENIGTGKYKMYIKELLGLIETTQYAFKNQSLRNWLTGYISKFSLINEKFYKLYLENREVSQLTFNAFKTCYQLEIVRGMKRKRKRVGEIINQMEKVVRTYDALLSKLIKQTHLTVIAFKPDQLREWLNNGHPYQAKYTPTQRSAMELLNALNYDDIFSPAGMLMKELDILREMMQGMHSGRHNQFIYTFNATTFDSLQFSVCLGMLILTRKKNFTDKSDFWFQKLTDKKWQLACVSPIDIFYQQLMQGVFGQSSSTFLSGKHPKQISVLIQGLTQIVQGHQLALDLFLQEKSISEENTLKAAMGDVFIFLTFSKLFENEQISKIPFPNREVLQGLVSFFLNKAGGMSFDSYYFVSFLCIDLGLQSQLKTGYERQYFIDQMSLFLKNAEILKKEYPHFRSTLRKAAMSEEKKLIFQFIQNLVETLVDDLLLVCDKGKELLLKWRENPKNMEGDVAGWINQVKISQQTIDMGLILKMILFYDYSNQKENDAYLSLENLVNLYNSQILIARPFIKLAEVFAPSKEKVKEIIEEETAPPLSNMEAVLSNEDTKVETKIETGPVLSEKPTHKGSPYRQYSEKLKMISNLIPMESEGESVWNRFSRLEMFRNGARALRFHMLCLEELKEIRGAPLVEKRVSEVLSGLLIEISQKIRLAYAPPNSGLGRLLYTHNGKLLFSKPPKEIEQLIDGLQAINGVSYHFLSDCTGYSLEKIDGIKSFCHLGEDFTSGTWNRELRHFDRISKAIISKHPKFESCSLKIVGGKLPFHSAAIKRMIDLCKELEKIGHCPGIYVSLHTEIQTELLIAVIQEILAKRGVEVDYNHNLKELFEMLEIEDEEIVTAMRYFDRGRRYLRQTAGTEHLIQMGELLHAKKIKQMGDFYTAEEGQYVEAKDLDQQIDSLQKACKWKTEVAFEIARRLLYL